MASILPMPPKRELEDVGVVLLIGVDAVDADRPVIGRIVERAEVLVLPSLEVEPHDLRAVRVLDPGLAVDLRRRHREVRLLRGVGLPLLGHRIDAERSRWCDQTAPCRSGTSGRPRCGRPHRFRDRACLWGGRAFAPGSEIRHLARVSGRAWKGTARRNASTRPCRRDRRSRRGAEFPSAARSYSVMMTRVARPAGRGEFFELEAMLRIGC